MAGHAEQNPTIWGTLRKDVRQGDFFQTLRDEAQELRDFYLSEERRDELRRMSPLKRWFVLAWWILKSMFFKLTPMRRILLTIGIVLILSPTVTFSNHRREYLPERHGDTVRWGCFPPARDDA